MSKQSAAEKLYYISLKQRVLEGFPSVISGKISETLHHPRLLVLGCGGSKKCRDWFALPVTNEEHEGFHGKKNPKETQIGWIIKTWEMMNFEPGEFMYSGLNSRQAYFLRKAVAYVLTSEMQD